MTRKDTFVVITLYSTSSINFWPYSRKQKPKQFLDLLGNGRSLLQLTFERSKGICPEENIFVSVSKEYASLVTEQLPFLSEQQILIEPVRRNSAPCIAYACYKIKKKHKNAVVVVCPADHAVFGEIAYVRDVRKGVEIASANKNSLLILGIKPHKAETAYGYIQYHHDGSAAVKRVKTFTEKPQQELARLFLESGDFAWNTKIFVWHVDAILEAFECYVPEVAETFRDGLDYYYTEEEAQFVFKAYSHCKNVSISSSILEKADNVYLILGQFDWSDLSSWNSLYDVKDKKDQQNITDGNVILIESRRCIVKSKGDKLVVVNGLKNYLVIDSEDALLITPKAGSENLKSITNTVKNSKGDKFI